MFNPIPALLTIPYSLSSSPDDDESFERASCAAAATELSSVVSRGMKSIEPVQDLELAMMLLICDTAARPLSGERAVR